MNNKGVIAVISGPSGVGKGTICTYLAQKYDDFFLSVSATSRLPRPNEVDGVHYHFKTPEQFKEMIANDEFLEYAGYVDKFYGTPKAPCYEHVEKGINAILEIEVQGGMMVKEKEPDTVMIFIVPPSMEELENRLRGRGTETEEVILQRLARAKEELLQMKNYDYIVVNNSVEEAAEQIRNILNSESLKTKNMINMVEKELKL
ncbi:MAG: guanylate kinase [Clostridia bacterium]|nr:guanylate kinase [Clostridia bacterium]